MLRNERKLLRNLFLLSMALLLSVIPYIEASASRYEPVQEETAASVVSLSSRTAASLIDLMPHEVFPMMKPSRAPTTTLQAPFSTSGLPGLDDPASAASTHEPASPIPEIKMAATVAPYQKYVTTAYYLNVREGASSDSPILRVVKQGDLLNVLKATENGWLQLYDEGFVHSAYAQPVADGADSVTKTMAPHTQTLAKMTRTDDSPLHAPATKSTKSSKPDKPTSAVHSDSGLTTEHIGQILEGTLLEDQSLVSAILEVEDEYGINAYFTIAVMKLESGNGKSKLARSKNNLFGLNATGGSNAKAYAFDTKADCVRKFGQLISDYYVDKGFTTVEKVAGKYCPANDNWSKLVKKIMYSDHSKLVKSPVV